MNSLNLLDILEFLNTVIVKKPGVSRDGPFMPPALSRGAVNAVQGMGITKPI